MCKTKSLGVFFASIVGLGLASALLWSLGGMPVFYAAGITVDTTDDELNSDGDCSLREAVQAANTDTAVDGCGPGVGADTIQFSLTTPAVITLTQGQLIIRNDPLTIQGPGVSLLAISGDDTSLIFNVTSNVAVTLSGMTVRDGNATSPGGGLRTVGTLTLIDTAFINNSAASSGGAVEVSGGLTMRDTDVLNNTAFGQGGGVNAFGSLTHITGGRFENNRAGSVAGGVYANGTLVLSGTQFISNTAQTYAGSTWAWQGATVTNARFERNTAQSNDMGALYVRYDLLMSGSSFISNTTGGQYGAVWAGGDVHITDGSFTGNVAQTGRSGALDVDGALWLTGTHFVGNRAATTSGAIDVQGDLRMSGCDVLSNTAGGQGGGVNGYGALVHITGGRFENNRAGSVAGGLYATQKLVLSGTQFISNSAGAKDGAVWAGGDARITAGAFMSNVAQTGRAGALDVGGALWLTNTHFIGNRAVTSGGALVHNGSDGRIVNALFARNYTDGDGGAMYLAHSGGVELVHTTIVAPAQSVSSAIFVGGGSVTITNTIVASYTYALDVAAGAIYEDYNLFYATVPISGAAVRGGHSLTGDPAFADSSHDDYHLTAYSWALNTGTDTGIAIDMDGDPRPGGSGVDIGYDETTHVSDAAIVKTVSADPVPGAPITYTITFSNVGTALLPSVVITDDIPAFVYQTDVVSSGVIITDTDASPAYVWQVRAFAAGEGGVIIVTGLLTDALSRGLFTNTVEIDTIASEAVTSNNTSEASVMVPNFAPVAAADAYTTEEDVAIVLSPLANDNDVDGDSLIVSAFADPPHGTAALSGTTQLVYTPTLNIYGADAFTYTASDGEATDTATITVTVIPANDAPVITEGDPVAVTMSEDGDPTPFDLVLNGADVESDPLAWAIATQPAHGQAAVEIAAGVSTTVAYTPTVHYYGLDVFVVQVSDGALTTTAVVSVTLEPVDDAPVAVDDSEVVLRYAGGDITLLATSQPVTLNVLANDEEVDGEELIITAVGAPNQGGLASVNGSLVVYTPAVAFTGAEAFTYTVSDGGLTDSATVSVTVAEGEGGGGSGDTFVVANTGAGGAFTITVEIPAGAEDTGHLVLVYDGLAEGSGALPGYEPAGVFFTLVGYLDGQLLGNGHTFQQPLTLTVDYRHADVSNIGPCEETLALFYWDGDDWASDGITVVERDLNNHRLVITIAHLTEFGMFRHGFIYLPLVMNNFVRAPDLAITSLNATSDGVEVTIVNQGNAPVMGGFWIEGYIDPSPAPTAVNQPWWELGDEGMVWAIPESALPLNPGESITLNVGDAYYDVALSRVSWPLPHGAIVYVQADAWNASTDYGAIRESHEIIGDSYGNNIGSDTVP